MESKLVQIGDRIINADYVQVVREWDDGTVKLFMAVPSTDGRVIEYEFDGDEGKKVFAWFSSKAHKIG